MLINNLNFAFAQKPLSFSAKQTPEERRLKRCRNYLLANGRNIQIQKLCRQIVGTPDLNSTIQKAMMQTALGTMYLQTEKLATGSPPMPAEVLHKPTLIASLGLNQLSNETMNHIVQEMLTGWGRELNNVATAKQTEILADYERIVDALEEKPFKLTQFCNAIQEDVVISWENVIKARLKAAPHN